jgi:hypothetical protein
MLARSLRVKLYYYLTTLHMNFYQRNSLFSYKNASPPPTDFSDRLTYDNNQMKLMLCGMACEGLFVVM